MLPDAPQVKAVPFKEKLRAEGISLRFIHSALVIVAMIVSWFLIYSTVRLTDTFLDVTEATDQYIEMHKAASETIDTESSKIAVMVSPSGFIISVSEHIKKNA